MTRTSSPCPSNKTLLVSPLSELAPKSGNFPENICFSQENPENANARSSFETAGILVSTRKTFMNTNMEKRQTGKNKNRFSAITYQNLSIGVRINVK
ncbi:hypothetical protein NAI64_03880 [Oxalobacter sp. OxGP1]|uniref:hypothetical protein n=1 Tax=Oxalobacter paeniformigenes TaxID=2946594 RepID=UPI0022AF8016|nr:hypothetical protein [Oxalobacter paeniformigenes]MCZ4052864.1 hypothetical protein [Oxalobacter paeniformigenes]